MRDRRPERVAGAASAPVEARLEATERRVDPSGLPLHATPQGRASRPKAIDNAFSSLVQCMLHAYIVVS